MSKYAISDILVDNNIQNHPYVQYVLDRFTETEVHAVESIESENIRSSWVQSKNTLFLTTFSGSFIKECPATGPPYLCCQYRILSPVVGCPLDCSYCILQHYVGPKPITVYVNWADLFEQVKQYLSEYPNQMIRIGSGELADSLALEPDLGMAEQWIPFFAALPNAVLELKTKTTNIEWLRSILHGGRTVIGWSINPSEITVTEERGADSVEERIAAAKKVISWGYKVAFHFDPILTVPGWEELYQDLVQNLCSDVPAPAVAWVSLGSLRFPPPLREVIRRRYPKTCILDGEWIRGMDGKSRLIKPLRIDMFSRLYKWIREGWGEEVYVYLCMESADVWREALGWEPESRDDVEKKFQQSWERKYVERFGSWEKVVDFPV